MMHQKAHHQGPAFKTVDTHSATYEVLEIGVIYLSYVNVGNEGSDGSSFNQTSVIGNSAMVGTQAASVATRQQNRRR
jgi:hypothetical protein